MVVPPAGLEPARLAAVDFESTVSAIPPEGHVGAQGGTRTHNTWFLRPVCIPIPAHALNSLRYSFGALLKGSLAEYP